MEFGDCFLFTEPGEEDSCLLVDCGSKVINSCGNVINDIHRDISRYKKKEALITHFHQDHIDGLTELTKKGIAFHKVYVPNIFECAYPGYVTVDLLEGILSLGGIRSKDLTVDRIPLIRFLRMITASGAPIELLDRSKDFSFGKTNMEVLWPAVHMLPVQQEWDRIERMLIDAGMDVFVTLQSAAERVCAIVLNRQEGDSTTLGEIEEDILRLIQQTEGISPDLRNRIRARLHKMAHEYNIVFQGNESDRGVLFTGDINAKELRRIAENSVMPQKPLYKKYFIYKAPHHGTGEPHYFHFAPYFASDYVAVTNGNAQRKYGKISFDYNNRTAVGISGYEMKCTNTNGARCESFQKTGGCVNCDYCNIGRYKNYIDLMQGRGTRDGATGTVLLSCKEDISWII